MQPETIFEMQILSPDVERRISDDIARGSLNCALLRIYRVVDTITTTPTLMPQPVGSEALDTLCQQIGEKTYAMLVPDKGAIIPAKEATHLYIATKLQKSGGHTRVIERLIESNPDVRHIVLSTERMGRSDRAFMRKRYTNNKNITFEFCARRSWLGTLMWLQKSLLRHAPVKTYLFNHHQDSASVAAIQPSMCLDAYFYHHGDHHLCLGATFRHMTHVDLHPMAFYQCRRVLGLDTQYLPMAAEDKGMRNSAEPFLGNGALVTCTAARSNKIEIPYFVNYCNVIPDLLAATGGRHIHIGTLSRRARRHITNRLEQCGVPADRFVYVPYVPSVWKALHQYHVDVYVASFPYGGGLTLVEAMGSGTPVILHEHLTSTILRCAELAYPGALRWRYPEELIRYCKQLTQQQLKEQSRIAREHYLRHHAPELLKSALAGTAEIIPAPDQTDRFIAAPDAWASWAEDVYSLHRRLGRIAYRYMRRLRNVLRM